jgi:hypothetical protein
VPPHWARHRESVSLGYPSPARATHRTQIDTKTSVSALTRVSSDIQSLQILETNDRNSLSLFFNVRKMRAWLVKAGIDE